jgi:hypothetical protein
MNSILNPVLHEPMQKNKSILRQKETLRGSAAARGIVVTIGSITMRA